jgi:hypothetical protein
MRCNEGKGPRIIFPIQDTEKRQFDDTGLLGCADHIHVFLSPKRIQDK